LGIDRRKGARSAEDRLFTEVFGGVKAGSERWGAGEGVFPVVLVG